MSWLKLEIFTKLLGSWTLLVSLSSVALALWLFPSEWINDDAVVAIRDQYRGQIGITGITLALLLIAKTLTKCIQFGYQKATAIPEKIKKNRNINVSRKKVMMQIQRATKLERELLHNCLKSGHQNFKLPPQDDRVKNLFNAGVIGIVDYDEEISEFKIHKWLWKQLPTILSQNKSQTNIEILADTKQSLVDDTKKQRS